MEEAWQEVLKSPDWLDRRREDTPRVALAWHEAETSENEAAGRWFAAAFHLRWLSQKDPSNADFTRRLKQALAKQKH